MTALTDAAAAQLPPLCYILHPTTGETVEICRRENRYHSIGTRCSPKCLNARLPHPPIEADINAMRHGSLIGWDTPGADPAFWRHRHDGIVP